MHLAHAPWLDEGGRAAEQTGTTVEEHTEESTQGYLVEGRYRGAAHGSTPQEALRGKTKTACSEAKGEVQGIQLDSTAWRAAHLR